MRRSFFDIPHWRSRLVASMLFSLACWLFLGLSLVRLVDSWAPPYLVANVPFFAMALALFLSIRYILTTDPPSLVTDHPQVRTRPLLLAFLSYLGANLLFLLITAVTDPSSLTVNRVALTTRLLFITAAVLITPLQTSCEEILFRIMPVRFLQGSKLKPSTPVALFSALLFVLPHLSNTEVAASESTPIVLLYYAIFGAATTALCLKSGGFEIALGVHAANNLFVAIIANYPSSSLPSHPFFLSLRPTGTIADLVQLSVSLGVVAVVTRKRKTARQVTPQPDSTDPPKPPNVLSGR